MNKANPLEIFINSFPSSEKERIISLVFKLNLETKLKPSPDNFQVCINGEEVKIPERIYYEEPNEANLDDNEKIILDCLFTRHHDGHIRENRLKKILLNQNYLITPFIMRLIGEYVLEILSVIQNNLNENLLKNLVRFKEENPNYFNKTRERVRSYWNCYYRNEFPDIEKYAGYQILQQIENFKV